MTTLNTNATVNTNNNVAVLNGAIVTVIEVKKGGWTTIQLSTGDVQKVRTNTLDFNIEQEEEPMKTELVMAIEKELDYSDLFSSLAMDELMKEAAEISDAQLDKCVAEFEAAEKQASVEEMKNTLDQALQFINACEVYKELQGFNGATQLLRSILESAKWFKSLAKFKAKTPVNSAEDYRVTREKYLMDTLSFFSAKNNLGNKLVTSFQWGLDNITAKYRCLTDDEIKNTTRMIDGVPTRVYSDRNLALTYVAPVEDAAIKVAVRRSAVVLVASAGTEIKFNNNTVVKLTANRSVGITSRDVKAGLIKTMSRVVFHNERVFTDGEGKETVVYDKSATNIDDLLSKIFLLKTNKVNLDKLLEDKLNQKTKVLVIKHGTHKLEDMAYPAYTLKDVYGTVSGLVSLPEAKSGYIVDLFNVRGLMEFSKGVAISVENVNKAIARADKQEKENGWAVGTYRMFVAYNPTTAKNPLVNEVLASGCCFMPEIFHDRHGLSRITSKIFEGGFKAATHFSDEFEAAYPGCGLIGPSAFKGGFIGLLELLGHGLDTLGRVDSKNLMDQLHKSVEANLAVVTFLGEEIKGMWVDVPVRVTNAIMVEQYQWAGIKETDSSLERASNLSDVESTPNGLRDYAMDLSIKDPSFSMVDFIQQGLEDESIVEKANITRHTASLFQTAVNWKGGVKHITKLIKSLVRNMPKGRASKVLAAQYLTGNYTVNTTVSAETIAHMMVNHAEAEAIDLLEDVATYPLSLRDDVLDYLGHDAESHDTEWTAIKFGKETIHVPNHNFMYNYEQEIATPRTFVATGFLKEVLEAVKKNIEITVNEDKVTYRVVKNSLNFEGKFLQAKLQSRLLGKNFGHLYTVGTYQLMLPSLTPDIAIHEVEVVDGTMFMPTDEFGNTCAFPDVLPVNGVKYPAYFEDAFAGYMMFEVDMGSPIVNFSMRKACFMNVETIMIMQNDCDGDLHQFTNDGYQLPLYTGPRGHFNESSFIRALEGEYKGNRMDKELTVHRTNIADSTPNTDFQDALYLAGTAKENIGKYTATKYVYETILQGVSTFVSSTGDILEVTEDTRKKIMSTISYLCQVEAMNNIKQANGTTIQNIMDMVSIGLFANFKERDGKTAEQNKQLALRAVEKRLQMFFAAEAWDVEPCFATLMVEALHYAAVLKSSSATNAYNIFNARVVGDKRFTAIAMEAKGLPVEDSFNFEGAYASSLDGVDSDSMYAYILKALVRQFGPKA